MSWGVLEEVMQILKIIFEMIECKRLLGFNKLKTTWQCNLLWRAAREHRLRTVAGTKVSHRVSSGCVTAVILSLCKFTQD